MNRQQAENLLNAYVNVSKECSSIGNTSFDDVISSLHEVIIDAMTTVRYYPQTITVPYKDWAKPIVTYDGTSHPYNPTYTVTCSKGE